MSRYIDADAFYVDMCKRTENDSWRDCWAEFVAILSEQPAADVVPMEFHNKVLEIEIKKQENLVEVVRCKDCEYWQTDWIPNTGGDRGCHYCEMMDSFTEPLNYCGYGECKILPKD